jgi:glycosyltransferase involved in cell wall biosynthesis
VHILIVTDAWRPQINGVVRTLSCLRRRLEAIGHGVAVIGPDRFRTLPCPTYPEIRLAICTPAGVGRMIEESEPDAVHIATEGPVGWAAWRWMRRRGLPFTTSFHTLFPEYLRLRFGLPEALSYRGMRCFHNAARATLCSTPTLRARLEARGFRRLVPWPRGVDSETFAPGPAARLPFPRPIQLYVGRIAVEKNVESFLRLDTAGTKVIVGDGPLRADLAQRYPTARFLGNLSGDELVRHYRAADVFVFPSRTDTLGQVMLEALACGVPVAAHPVQGPTDVIGNSGAGALDNDLAAAVRGAIGIDPALCRARALRFRWDRSVREFLRHLAPLPASSPSRRLHGEIA